jgi:hypothetical protein
VFASGILETATTESLMTGWLGSKAGQLFKDEEAQILFPTDGTNKETKSNDRYVAGFRDILQRQLSTL